MSGLTPYPKESLRSFIIRLSSANDYDCIHRLFAEHRDGKQISIDSCDNALVGFLKPLAGIEGEAGFMPASPSGYGNRLGLTAMMDTRPHVCPSCVVETGFMRSEWQLHPVTHCSKHQNKLLTHCKCGAPFKWDHELLEFGCSECFASWADIAATQPKEAIPQYLEHFESLNDELKADFLEDLFTGCMRALRPYDSVHHGVKQLPHYVEDWTGLSQQAFDMLSKMEIINQWCSSLVYKREDYEVFGNEAVFYPLVTLQEKLHMDWLVKGIKPSICSIGPSQELLPFYEQSSCKARNDAIGDIDVCEADSNYIHHLDQYGFARMTGCSVVLARKLFKIPSISSLTKVGRGRFSFIDVTEFIEQSKAMNTELKERTTSLAELKDLKGMYGLSDDDLIMEIYKYRLPIHINAAAANIVDAISVNRQVINTHLETTYLKCQKAVSLTRAKAILCIPRNRVLQLVNLGLLKEVPSKPKTHFISGASIAKFCEVTFVLNAGLP